MSKKVQETGFLSMMKQLYGDFGVDSEVGKLRSVLMRKPGKEIEGITDPEAVAMKEIWDPVKVRSQHEALVQLYLEQGIEVHYIEDMDPDLPNAIYARDLVFMTPEGAIIARPAAGCRLGEEVYAAKQLAKIGVPIIKTVNGNGVFDGACGLWLDQKTCFLGYGKRCNPSATAQVEEELRNMGVDNLIKVEIPRGMAHLDSFMAMADLKVALVLKIAAPDTIYTELEKRDIKIVDIPDYDEFCGFCQNFVALEPGKIVMPTGCPKTVAALEKAGVECIQLDVSEIMKGNGAIHCMTAFLKRDSVPLYEI